MIAPGIVLDAMQNMDHCKPVIPDRPSEYEQNEDGTDKVDAQSNKIKKSD